MRNKIKYIFIGVILSVLFTTLLSFSSNSDRSDRIITIKAGSGNEDLSSNSNLVKYTSLGYKVESISCNNYLIVVHLVK